MLTYILWKYICIFLRTYEYICMHVCMHACMYVCMYARMYVYTYVCIYIHIYYEHIYYEYVCIFVCMYLYTYILWTSWMCRRRLAAAAAVVAAAGRAKARYLRRSILPCRREPLYLHMIYTYNNNYMYIERFN